MDDALDERPSHSGRCPFVIAPIPGLLPRILALPRRAWNRLRWTYGLAFLAVWSRPRALLYRALSRLHYALIRPTTRFCLLTTAHKERDPRRAGEYRTCLLLNIANPYIEKIVVFYELVAGEGRPDLEDHLRHSKVEVVFVERPSKRLISYQILIDHANRSFPGRLVIITNADIYMDCSLRALSGYDWSNRVLALTRHNTAAWASHYTSLWRRHPRSQDSWMFKAPLALSNGDVNLGWLGCDNLIAGRLMDAGFEVANPSDDIRCWHIHSGADRSYVKDGADYSTSDEFAKSPGVPITRLL